MEGYVYILEVRDILLPVCKIGMTTRTPDQRLLEINQGSTGDFLWDVAYQFYVNDCATFEQIIHKALAPLRQKRREFFNLSPDDAHQAVISILEQTIEIVELLPNSSVFTSMLKPTNRKPKRKFATRDAQYAHWLDAFNDYFEVVGKPFGQTNKPFFGISDGVVGVQWNLIVDTEKNTVELGVNLEGSEKMGGMLITDFLLARPSLTALKQACATTPEIFLAIFRDAWQVSSRPAIEEQYVGGKLHSLRELSEQQWTVILDEALSCLEADYGYRKRKRLQWVTLKTTGQKKQLDISPHLQIKTFINVDADPYEAIKAAVEILMPVREWVMQAIAEYQAASQR